MQQGKDTAKVHRVLYIFAYAIAPFPDSYAGMADTIRRLGIEVEALDLRTLTFEGYVAAINRFKPDIIFCFVRSSLQKIASYVAAYHPVCVLNWFHEEPNCTVQARSLVHSALFDFWFTIDNRMVPFYKTNAHFMPPAFDETVYMERGVQRTCEVSYVGQLGHKRSWCMFAPYMVAMAQHDVLLCIEPSLSNERLSRLLRSEPQEVEAYAMILRLEMLKRQHRWPRPYGELEKSWVISRSKIHVGLSRVRGQWEARLRELLPEYPIDATGLFYQPKGRTFEAVGAGAMLLNDYYPEMEGFFDLGKEAVTFQFGDQEDFADKLQWYIEHDSEREEIAYAGWKRGQRDHTLTHRVQQILEIAGAGCG